MVFQWRRRRVDLSPEQVAAEHAAYEHKFAPLTRDVQEFIEPAWEVTFRYEHWGWWFDMSVGTNGSYNGSLTEVAVYVGEDLRGTDRWPSCSQHGMPLRLVTDRADDGWWTCEGPPTHRVPLGELGSLLATP